ncbi:MAG TPA: IgGFc-binding protein [Polyangiaceae bacterium]|jgi:hypothetical protein
MRSFLLLGACGALVCVLAACGSGVCSGQFCEGADGGADGTIGPGTDGGIVFGDSAAKDGGPCAMSSCSGDLHDVLDCNGNVVQTCPPDQGCAAGTCAPACAAAKANKSSVGCDYYAVPATDFTGQTCFAVYVANTWGSPVSLTASWGGQNFTSNLSKFAFLPQGTGQNLTYTAITNGQVPVGGVAILFLSGAGCPEPTATSTDTSAPGTQVTNAFHITASAPVVLYDIFPYGGGNSAVTSATLLLPSSAWDTNYVATSAWSETGFGNPWIGFVAQQDGTQISIVPTADIAAGTGVAADSSGKLGVYTLNAGQLIRFQQPIDLTGSIVQSNFPIGGWGGHGCTNLETKACDGMHQQIPPVKALGHEYVAVRYRNRLPSLDEAPPWRFVGAVDGTTLSYDPPQTGAPTSLKEGQFVEWDAKGPFVVRSQDAQHPFFFGAHMTGCFTLPGDYSSPVGCAGDPEFVDVIPPDQYLNSYIFFTDPTYPETNLVFVRKKGNDGAFHDVTLDCAGVVGGWQNVDAAGNYQYTRADVQTGDFSKVGNCDNGRNAAHSDIPFALTIWGWGSNATRATFSSEACSYAYPAGASVQPINGVVVPPTPH